MSLGGRSLAFKVAVGQAWVPGGGQKLLPARVWGARAGTASWLKPGLAEARAAFLCRRGQKGHLARLSLAGTSPASPLQLLPHCPTRSSLCLPRAGPRTQPLPNLHASHPLPLTERMRSPSLGGFQGMMCTPQGVQLARREVSGSCSTRAWLGAVSSVPCSWPASCPQHFCC